MDYLDFFHLFVQFCTGYWSQPYCQQFRFGWVTFWQLSSILAVGVSFAISTVLDQGE